MEAITVGGGGGHYRLGGRPRRDVDETDGNHHIQQRHPSSQLRIDKPQKALAATHKLPRQQPQPPQNRMPTPDIDEQGATLPSPAKSQEALPRHTPPPHAIPSPPPTAERPRPASRRPSGTTRDSQYWIDSALLPPLHTITPGYLACLARNAHDGEAWFSIRGVTREQVHACKWLFPHDDHDDDSARGTIRAEYDPLTRDLLVKCMACPVHDIVGDFFTQVLAQATYAADAPTALRHLRPGVREYTGFTGIAGLSGAAAKIPDFSIRGAHARFPSFVVECGWSESLAKLQADAALFLLGSRGATKVVVLVNLREKFPAAYAEGSHSHAVSVLKHRLPPAYTGERCIDSLAEFYVATKATLVPPLVGAIDGTAMVYARTKPEESATRPHLKPDAKFPGITCVCEIPFLADSTPRVDGAVTFELALADILEGGGGGGGGGAAGSGIAFNLGALAAAIIKETPIMEWHRAVKRARHTLEAYDASHATAPSAAGNVIPATATLVLSQQKPIPSVVDGDSELGRGAKRATSSRGEDGMGDEIRGDADGSLPFTAWKKAKLMEDEHVNETTVEDDANGGAWSEGENEEDTENECDDTDGEYIP
ncbi:hypothetical protein DFH27DRAFT_309168 [Peziza echinospora]|nr:hypothetical protein DFH27DRAFT_309168 [Peziza echinospora]